jgi:hypothetical protein
VLIGPDHASTTWVANGKRLRAFAQQPHLHTPFMLVKEVILDKVWVKHWEYKS